MFLKAQPEDFGKYKTPGLRDVARTAPYMHQGQLSSLEDVAHYYSTFEGALPRDHHQETFLWPLQLSASEERDLVDFLGSLSTIDPATDDYPATTCSSPPPELAGKRPIGERDMARAQTDLNQLFLGVQDFYYNVRDMKQAVRFYRDVLGCTVLEESDYWSSLQLGTLSLGLHWTGGAAVPRTPRDAHGAHAGGTVTLRVSDIDAAAAHLTATGTRLLGPVMREPWGELLTFEDPDGNVLKLMKPAAG